MDNTITITGALGGDPELRYTTSGRALSNLSVAVSRRWKNKATGEFDEETSWFRVTCWAELAENVAASLRKGQRVVVTGRMQSRRYDKDGESRTAWDLVADEVAPSLRWATATVEATTRTMTTEEPEWTT